MHKKTIEQFMKIKPHTVFWLVYKHRIDKYIDNTLDMTLWLAKTHPAILLDVERLGNKRMKQLLLIIKALMKENIDVELVLKEA